MNFSRRLRGWIVLFWAALTPAHAAINTFTSTNFSLGYGYVNPWTTTETFMSNTPTTVNGFTFSPTVASSSFSGTGPGFTFRQLHDAGGASGDSIDWTNTVSASWSGPAPLDAMPNPNYKIQLNITSLRIYGAAYFAFPGTTNLAFGEITPDHFGNSTSISLNVVSSVPNLTFASNYKQLTWDPADFQTNGTSMSRTFILLANTDKAIDGFEVFGNVTITYDAVPEPSVLALALSAAGILTWRRRSAARK